MSKNLLKAVALIFISAVAASCAKDVSESSETIQNRILESWISVNYGGTATKTASGAYIISSEMGTGAKVGDSSYVYVNYSTKQLNGDYVTTNRQSTAQQLGTFSYSAYYGSNTWRLGQGAIYPGIEEVLKGMKQGGKVTIVLPPSLTVITNALYSNFSSSGETENIIYEIEVVDVVEDQYEYEKSVLEKYSADYFNGMDSIVEGFYFKKSVEVAASDTIENEATIKIRYIGRLLNGFVFDTNIQDTAKKYRIYDSSNDYKALDATFNTDLATYIENNSVVTGFAKAIVGMRYGEKATAFFWSPMGYKESGKSGTIPEYSPLCFEVYIEPKN
ncbi:MAG: FKBP-type peptidyl-prolyl cis-trans isomerase [Bacteroidales bacterium]|nr:FKBP-type peptidyl-prolyl cis-trans isomerase [Bacteroidales bacterium]MDD4670222.1 FKBP-type peptidyl-prolyl cis-trans isomerase [Bacteroidales bacterium]